MPKAYDTWTVLPHRPLEKLEPNLWRVEGNLPRGKGTRVMTIAKRSTGGLVIHNAIALEDELMKEIEAFGTPELLVVPNGYHRLDAKVFKQRYPNMKVVCPTKTRKRVEDVVAVDGSYADAGDDADVKLAHLPGTKDGEGYLDIKSGEAHTLVFNDCLFNLPKLGGVLGFIMAPTGQPAVPRLAKWMLIKDAPVFTSAMHALGDTPGLRRIIVSHGKVIDQAPADVLRGV